MSWLRDMTDMLDPSRVLIRHLQDEIRDLRRENRVLTEEVARLQGKCST